MPHEIRCEVYSIYVYGAFSYYDRMGSVSSQNMLCQPINRH